MNPFRRLRRWYRRNRALQYLDPTIQTDWLFVGLFIAALAVVALSVVFSDELLAFFTRMVP